MLRWEAAIATDNPRILYRAVQLLKKLGIDFVICTPTDSRCDNAHVVITNYLEGLEHHTGRIQVEEDFDTDFVRIALISKLREVQNPTRAFIGIDPGMTFGLALVIDGVPVYQNSLAKPSNIAELVQRLQRYTRQLFPKCSIVTRVGTGSKLYTALVLRILVLKIPEQELEMVNEHRTTIRGGPKSNESSAILIAGRTGRPMKSADMILELKEGYIQSVKQYITQLSRGKRIVSRSEARALLLGEISIDELISTP
ncbi:MAG: hypothetical protein JW779_05120 [Candidatus Thorarchaeota archaeon]|nr:hypothetical protein [Candidatus Thorarchaeota archaeon]